MSVRPYLVFRSDRQIRPVLDVTLIKCTAVRFLKAAIKIIIDIRNIKLFSGINGMPEKQLFVEHTQNDDLKGGVS